MSANGYNDSLVQNKKRNNSDYRDSGFNDEDNNSNIENELEGENKVKISPFNISNNEKKIQKGTILTLNDIMCIANLLASTLGAGAFVYPYILYQIGIINFLFVFIFISITVYYSLDLLRRFVVDSKLFSFGFIVERTLGALWLKIYAISAFLFYMSCIVNYLDFLYKFIKGLDDFFKKGLVKFFFFLISCIIEILLCIFTNKISKIHYLSLIVVCLFIIILLVLIIKTIIVFKDGEFKSFDLFTIEDKDHNKNTNWTSFLFIMAKIIELFYGFIYHSSFPTLLSGLDNISNENTKKVQNISYIVLVIIYAIFTFFGCSFYDEHLNLTFEEGVTISNKFLKFSFTCVLILLFLTLIPIRYIVIRDNYSSLFGQEELPLKYEIIITSICLIINNLIVYFTGNSNNFISQVMHYFGGALGVFICFVLPVISYIAINRKVKLRAIIGYIIAGIFIVIGFFSIFYNFQSKDDKTEE